MWRGHDRVMMRVNDQSRQRIKIFISHSISVEISVDVLSGMMPIDINFFFLQYEIYKRPSLKTICK